jgi:hypothetical protein
VDRLDAWLNAQRGWRRLALVWLQLYPASIVIANGYLTWRNRTPDQPPAISYVSLLTLAVPVATVLAVPFLLLRTARVRRIRRRGGLVEPFLSWRFTALFLLLAGSMTLGVIINDHGVGWRQQHEALWNVVMALAIAAVVLGLETFRYAHCLRRPANQPANDPPLSTT